MDWEGFWRTGRGDKGFFGEDERGIRTMRGEEQWDCGLRGDLYGQ